MIIIIGIITATKMKYSQNFCSPLDGAVLIKSFHHQNYPKSRVQFENFMTRHQLSRHQHGRHQQRKNSRILISLDILHNYRTSIVVLSHTFRILQFHCS